MMFERFVAIDKEISAGHCPSLANLARRAEVCARTIQRDIEFLRYRVGFPIVYDGERNGYVCRVDAPEGDKHPSFSRREMAAFFKVIEKMTANPRDRRRLREPCAVDDDAARR